MFLHRTNILRTQKKHTRPMLIQEMFSVVQQNEQGKISPSE